MAECLDLSEYTEKQRNRTKAAEVTKNIQNEALSRKHFKEFLKILISV